MKIDLVPDGALLDRAAEFICQKEDGVVRLLFHGDPDGYCDALHSLIQALVSPEITLIGHNKRGLIEETDQLKENLSRASKLRKCEVFGATIRDDLQRSASGWLDERWTKIIAALSDQNSMAHEAILGHLKRDFYYFRIKPQPIGDPKRYLSSYTNVQIPTPLLDRLTTNISAFAENCNRTTPEQDIRRWIEGNVASHFRIFGEYWLHVGQNTGFEYMPALTRSSLNFLQENETQVNRVIMPFVCLAALKRVKRRQDLVENVLDWAQGEGRRVVNGITELHQVYRAIKDDSEQNKLLEDVHKVLTEEFPPPFSSILGLVQIVKGDISAAENTVRTAKRSLTYRWLWRIRNTDLWREWRKRLADLT